MKDSYAIFLNKFGIDPKDFLDHGLEDLMMIDKETARKEWDQLVKTIEHGGTTYIRKFGKTGENTKFYFEMYKEIFPLLSVEQDPNTNEKPKKMLLEALKVSEVSNYQASHVFGHTCNIFCFMAPWNIVLMPKIYDPLTGHESKGELRDNFFKMFREKIIFEFGDLIIEYNSLMKKYELKISAYLEALVPQETNEVLRTKEIKKISGFKKSVAIDFKMIEM